MLQLSFVSQNLPIYPNLLVTFGASNKVAKAFNLAIYMNDSIRVFKFKQAATGVAFSLKNRLCRFFVDDLNCHVFYF